MRASDETTKTPVTEPCTPRAKRRKGFAAMSPERVREIGAMGGRAAHVQGKAHRWTPEEAQAAGRAAQAQGKAHRWTSEEARAAGRKGGRARNDEEGGT